MPLKLDTARMLELAATVQKQVTELQELLSARDSIPISAEKEGDSIALPKEAFIARDSILDATSELYDSLLDPLTLLFQKGAHNNSVSLQLISHYGIAAMVPADGQVSFAEIAAGTGLPEQLVQRLLRHAMTMRVFREPEPGMVAHTRVSRALAIPHINDWMRVGTGEMWPAAIKMVDAIQKWPDSQEPGETAYALANDATQSIYGVLQSDPVRALRFSSAMKAYASSPELSVSYVLDHYDWGALGKAQVIDIGGARGHVAIEIARRFPNLQVLVQDRSDSIVGADAELPAELKQRVNFAAHDFFTPQTVTAHVYYFRWVMHNWSDKYCIIILRALIPALRPGARILIQDTCMPEPGTIARWREKDLRAADLNMLALFNARERSAREWGVLLSQADAKFVLKGVIEPPGSSLALIDVRWDSTG